MTLSVPAANKVEFGDWQTNLPLAVSVCEYLKDKGVRPQVVVEPTCGTGNFILAALLTFDSIEDVYGIEIRQSYLDRLREKLDKNPRIAGKASIHLRCQSIFEANLAEIKAAIRGRTVLAIGNPPWVTNSKLGGLDSANLPRKANFKNAKGIEAITGKGNFDIAEFICRQLVRLLDGENAHMAFLLKNSVVRNLVLDQGQNGNPLPLGDMEQLSIDAQKEFGVAVAASVFRTRLVVNVGTACTCYDFRSKTRLSEYGWVDGKFVSDIQGYAANKAIDGKSPFVWRSGVKHDCAKLMELDLEEGRYVNGLGELVDVEDEAIYPLLKSSDIKGGEIARTRKYVILTQHSANEDTTGLEERLPRLYRYLTAHAAMLDGRKSTIYRKRPRFCMFGIGPYTFKKYKVVTSGLYKHARFALAPEIGGKCVIPDDTCYFLGFDRLGEAKLAITILNSRPVQEFIRSVYFPDAKRAITKDLLMRIDLEAALRLIRDESLVGNDFAARFSSPTPAYVQASLF